MAQETQPYKRTLSGSLGAGLGSIFGSSGKKYYILEHKINSKYHKAGESQEIIVNQIELGRDPKCQVRFDETFTTVSRRHAAIIQDGNNWKLVQLSTTNPTFLNGKKVEKEWYLQNRDEIQLSVGGPKLSFIIPTGNKSTVGSIGLSRRLSLFRQQALRPYKQAIIILYMILILAIAGLTGWMILRDSQWSDKMKAAQQNYDNDKRNQDSTYNAKFNEQKNKLAEEQARNEKMKSEFESRIANLQNNVPSSANVNVQPSQSDDQAVNKCEPFVFHIRVTKIEITYNEETKEVDYGWIGTGFLLKDGRFVTARHVIEPWFFPVQGGQIDQNMLALNKIANNGGKIVVHFKAYSSSGNNISFTNEQFVCERSQDKSGVDDDGFAVKYVTDIGDKDWAYYKTSESNGLDFDSNKSISLERGTELSILGFPLGLGANSPSDITPQLSHGETTAKGLTNGVILAANTSYEQGNSGGPVFFKEQSGDYSVIGIVSAEAGRSTGFIVPIASIR